MGFSIVARIMSLRRITKRKAPPFKAHNNCYKLPNETNVQLVLHNVAKKVIGERRERKALQVLPALSDL